jgi:hypothetical protein
VDLEPIDLEPGEGYQPDTEAPPIYEPEPSRLDRLDRWQRVGVLGAIVVMLFGLGIAVMPFHPPGGVYPTKGCGPAVVEAFRKSKPLPADVQQTGVTELIATCRDEGRHRLLESAIVLVLAALGGAAAVVVLRPKPA